MSDPIGYYVHHQGDGHRQRALEIASAAPDRFVLLGTGLTGRTPGVASIDLDDDRPDAEDVFSGRDAASARPDALHYAPYHHPGVRARAARFADWIARTSPALVVIDVSVEMAMLARLCSTPVVYVRLSGDRSDPAHLDAFRGAAALLAPFHETLDSLAPDWVRQKTHYVAPRDASGRRQGSGVLVVHGRGGPPLDGARLAAAAASTPDRRWTGVGPITSPAGFPPNLQLRGWIENVAEEMDRAEIVVGAAGDGLVNAVIAAGKSFICLPEPRAYGEQVIKAAALARAGAAIVLDHWPEASRWPAILQDSLALRACDQQAVTGEGLKAAGDWLLGLASDLRGRT
jgi:Glycosyltransferase family 28 C-terminal domain